MAKKSNKKNTQMDAYRKVRKPMPPPSKVINPRKKYDRKDQSWRNEDE
jgi:hypothetical protein